MNQVKLLVRNSNKCPLIKIKQSIFVKYSSLTCNIIKLGLLFVLPTHQKRLFPLFYFQKTVCSTVSNQSWPIKSSNSSYSAKILCHSTVKRCVKILHKLANTLQKSWLFIINWMQCNKRSLPTCLFCMRKKCGTFIFIQWLTK